MKKIILSAIFNIAETAIILMIGRIMEVPMNVVIIIMGVFFTTRLLCGKPKHYNKWYRCCVWSSLVFTSLYALSNIDLPAIIVLTAFTALITTGKADIQDIYMWKGNASKFEDVSEFIKYNRHKPIVQEFEESLEKQDGLKYMIYKYRFVENLSFSEISERLDIPTQRITEELNAIALSARMYCKI